MKTTLTIEQSKRLIELGIDPGKASMSNSCAQPYKGARGIVQLPVSRPIFTLSDLLTILPKEIKADTIMGEDWQCALVVRWDVNRQKWFAGYELIGRPIDCGIEPELIDALYSLLIWAIEHHHINPEKQ